MRVLITGFSPQTFVLETTKNILLQMNEFEIMDPKSYLKNRVFFFFIIQLELELKLNRKEFGEKTLVSSLRLV